MGIAERSVKRGILFISLQYVFPSSERHVGFVGTSSTNDQRHVRLLKPQTVNGHARHNAYRDHSRQSTHRLTVFSHA